MDDDHKFKYNVKRGMEGGQASESASKLMSVIGGELVNLFTYIKSDRHKTLKPNFCLWLLSKK